MWTVLALNSLERLGPALSENARTSLSRNRERARAWLKEAKPATRIDWLALQMRLAREFGETRREGELRQELLAQQNADGGWGFTRGGESLPHVTGESLHALSLSGTPATSRAVQAAAGYLLKTQRADGSWEAISRQALGAGKPRKVNEITNHWGTAWASLGLLSTLPVK